MARRCFDSFRHTPGTERTTPPILHSRPAEMGTMHFLSDSIAMLSWWVAGVAIWLSRHCTQMLVASWRMCARSARLYLESGLNLIHSNRRRWSITCYAIQHLVPIELVRPSILGKQGDLQPLTVV